LLNISSASADGEACTTGGGVAATVADGAACGAGAGFEQATNARADKRDNINGRDAAAMREASGLELTV
jgi:hypothetical protein